MRQALALLLATLGAASPAWSIPTTYWIDASQPVMADCGTQSNPCPNYARLVGDVCTSPGCGCMNLGCRPGPGDSVFWVSGTYAGDGNGHGIGIPFSGSPDLPLTFQCVDRCRNYLPGTCTITGDGVTVNQALDNYCGLLTTSTNHPVTSSCSSPPNGATFINIRGFNLIRPPALTQLLVTNTGSDHILIEDCTFDGGTTAQRPLWQTAQGTHHITVKHSTFLSCPNAANGCTFLQGLTNYALVNNHWGPVAPGSNAECITGIDNNTALIDGNICSDSTTDGIDTGQNNPIPTHNMIIRYNQVVGASSRSFPLSGNDPTTNDGNVTGPNVIYNNVGQPNESGQIGRNVELYGGADGVALWNNTFFGKLSGAGGGYGECIWLDPRYGGNWSQNHTIRYNVCDSMAGPNTDPDNPGLDSIIVLDHDGTTITACPSTAPCPFVGNLLFAPERGNPTWCIAWGPYPPDQPVQTFTCDDFGGSFSTIDGHSGNVRANPPNPWFADRTRPWLLASLAPGPQGADLIDKADTFCHASSGSGNTISVSCIHVDGTYWFPDPADYYELHDPDCLGGGVRAASAVNPGCFTFQIEGGCGVREIASRRLNAITGFTDITFNGAPCSWTSGAKVGMPWLGAAPDRGAIEFGTTTTTSVTTTSTNTCSPSTTSSSTSTSTILTTTSTSSTTSTTVAAGTCVSPVVIPAAGGTFSGTTSGSSALTGSCASATGGAPEMVFRWAPSSTGSAIIQTCGTATTFDTVVYVRSGTCTSGAEIACNDDTDGCGTGDGCWSATHHGSRVTAAVTAGQVYYIVVDGYAMSCGGSSGAFSLSVTPP